MLEWMGSTLISIVIVYVPVRVLLLRRLSDSLIQVKWTRRIYMWPSPHFFKRMWKYDYQTQRKEIGQALKQDYLQGLNAVIKSEKCKKFKVRVKRGYFKALKRVFKDDPTIEITNIEECCKKQRAEKLVLMRPDRLVRYFLDPEIRTLWDKSEKVVHAEIEIEQKEVV